MLLLTLGTMSGCQHGGTKLNRLFSRPALHQLSPVRSRELAKPVEEAVNEKRMLSKKTSSSSSDLGIQLANYQQGETGDADDTNQPFIEIAPGQDPDDRVSPERDPAENSEQDTTSPEGEQASGAIQPMSSRSRAPVSPGGALTLNEVIESVTRCYPQIEIAVGEIMSTNGKAFSAQGAFDQVASFHSISQPLGFYQTYRNGVGLAQPLFQGGEVYGTYRIGDGNFEPWFGERETNEGGELKAGFSIPLVKDSAIDARRAKLWGAQLQRDQVSFNVETRLLHFQRMATQAYWDWVAAGQAVNIQQRLLDLANLRVDNISERVKEGDLAEIANIDNNRFIAKRKNTLIKANRALQKTAIKLSLFVRDGSCCPVIANNDRLPQAFPDTAGLDEAKVCADIAFALDSRPELAELRALRQQACVDLRYAQNLTLPKVDLKGFAGQDLGGATSSKGDKTPFELQLGVLAEVPLQRRKGRGLIQVAEGKLNQVDAKIRFTSDKIRAEIQDAASAVNAAYEQIQQSSENLDLTRQSLELGRESFDAGNIGLIELNIYETAVADAELQLLDAEFKYQYYLAAYITAYRQRAFE